MGLHQDQHSVRPDLCLNHSQRLSAATKFAASMQSVKKEDLLIGIPINKSIKFYVYM